MHCFKYMKLLYWHNWWLPCGFQWLFWYWNIGLKRQMKKKWDCGKSGKCLSGGGDGAEVWVDGCRAKPHDRDEEGQKRRQIGRSIHMSRHIGHLLHLYAISRRDMHRYIDPYNTPMDHKGDGLLLFGPLCQLLSQYVQTKVTCYTSMPSVRETCTDTLIHTTLLWITKEMAFYPLARCASCCHNMSRHRSLVTPLCHQQERHAQIHWSIQHSYGSQRRWLSTLWPAIPVAVTILNTVTWCLQGEPCHTAFSLSWCFLNGNIH